MKRKNINTTLSVELYSKIQKLALKVSAEREAKVNANDLVEEGMALVIEKYSNQDSKPQ